MELRLTSDLSASSEAEAEKRREQTERLAREVLLNARTELLLHLQYLDRALYTLRLKESDSVGIGCDGEVLFYDPGYVLIRFKEDRTFTRRVWLHVLVHCLFAHMLDGDDTDTAMWDLSADLFAEYIACSLWPKETSSPMLLYRMQEIRKWAERIPMESAETIYGYFMEEPPSPDEYQELRELTLLDEHAIWRERSSSGEGSSKGVKKRRGGPVEAADADEGEGSSDSPGSPEGTTAVWKRIAGEMQDELLARSRQMGERSADFLRALSAVHPRGTDYRDFLRRFASMSEVMLTSQDEFDYIFYTYGLSLYRDMPLVEPLEYREDRKIREFVIVIDTSGSVAGGPVERFLTETWQVLKTREAFAERFVLHIIQCDAFVKRDDVIRDQAEFDRYIRNLTLHGFGGTDFRPAFLYVDELIAERKLRDLKGLLYFTDGLGIFPEKPPEYPTAFLFTDEDSHSHASVPVWAIAAVMDGKSLRVYERRA